MRKASGIALALLLAAGCSKPPPPGRTTASTPAIEDRDWALVSLGANTNPLGNGGLPATLRLDRASGRAAGSAGCNRFSSTYTLTGDSLVFEAAMSTEMACPEGMELEAGYLAAIPQVTTYAATDSTLTLNGATGPLARFRAQ